MNWFTDEINNLNFDGSALELPYWVRTMSKIDNEPEMQHESNTNPPHDSFFGVFQTDYQSEIPHQGEDSNMPKQVQTEEAFEIESKEEEKSALQGDPAPVHKESGSRYTVAEDLQILKYTSIHPLSSAGSRKYWQQVVMDPSFPCKYRTVESLRDRYRYQLRFVEEEDKKRMEEWVKMHGDKGYSIFNTLPQKGPGGKKAFHRKLVFLGLENQSGCSPSKAKEKSSPQLEKSSKKNCSSKSKIQENPKLAYSISVVHASTSAGANQQQLEEEEVFLAPAFLKQPELEVHKSNGSLQTYLSEVDECYETVSNSKKRKEYSHMYDTDAFIMPYKAIKSNSQSDFLHIGHEQKRIENKEYEDVIQENSRKSKIMDLFYSCSMNVERVKEYLTSSRAVSWSEEEDRLLMSSERELHIRTLSILKGAANVQERVQFLEKFNELFSQF